MEGTVKLLESIPKFNNERQQQLFIQVSSVVAASSAIYASYKLITSSSRKKQNFKEIPQPGSAYPFIGHLLSLGDKPSNTITQWHSELGPIIKIRMGVQIWIMVADPALAHKIFVTNGAETSHRPVTPFIFEHVTKGGKGFLAAQPGTSLKENRSAALTVLAPKMIASKYLETIKQESRNLVSRLIETSKADKNGLDPLKNLELNSINIIFSACFGRKFNDVKDPEFIRLATLIEENIKIVAPENDLGNFFPIFTTLGLSSKNQTAVKDFFAKRRDPTYRQLVSEAIDREGPNVVKSLKENGFNFTEDELLVFTSDIVAAATDTISVTLHWLIAIMCNYPEAQKKVAEEIDQFVKLNGHVPEFTERLEVPYCISVIKECMRFKPTTPFGVPHFVKNNDVVVDGYLIPKGSIIMADMVTIHKQTDLYPDPDTFRPDRFMNNLKTMHAAANGKFEERDHFNFGFGRRLCPGIYMAEIEIFSAFIEIFSRTFIEPVKEMPNIVDAQNGGLTFTALPYKVKFIDRRQVS